MIVSNAAVPAAGTYVFPVVVNSKPKISAIIQGLLTYGSGGTSIKVFLQTSLDDGTTWRDVACLAFLLASLNKVSLINRFNAVTASLATDGTLADDTVINLLGYKWRVKVVVVGAYAGSNLRVDVNFSEDR